MSKCVSRRGLYRKERFRRRFIFIERFPELVKEWAERLDGLRRAWRAQSLQDAEVAALYLLIGLDIFMPGRWAVGPSRLQVRSLSRVRWQDWLKEEARLEKWLPANATLSDLVGGISLRGVRLNSRQILARWLGGEVPLRLTEKIPSPEELLRIQVTGQRIVTAIFSPEKLGGVIHDGRDPLSFFLHDLGHAAQFFSDPERQQAQMRCYRQFLTALRGGWFDSIQNDDPEWVEKFHYVIADLNSHPEHIWSTFWAQARESFYRRDPLLGGPQFQAWRERLCQLWAEAHCAEVI